MPASQADFEKVFAYGADMLGTSQACKLVLAAKLSHAQESSWVTIDNHGEVVGYLIMSKTIRFPEEGYYIAPLYADSAEIARSLLKVAVEFAAPNNQSINQSDVQLFSSVGGRLKYRKIINNVAVIIS